VSCSTTKHLLLAAILFCAAPFTTFLPAQSTVDSEVKTAPTAKLYTTRTPQFSIPYTLQQSTETIVLFVSNNFGNSWRKVAIQGSEKKTFRFQAPRDGEYWFCSRIQQSTKTPTNLRPQMRVFVDTQQPEIELQTNLTPAGEVTLKCNVRDVTLIAKQVSVEIQPAPNSPWQSFPLIEHPTLTQPGLINLTGRWQPTKATRMALLRVKVLDGAGNLAIAERRIYFPPSSQQRPQAYKPLRNPYTRAAPHKDAVNWPADNQLATPAIANNPANPTVNVAPITPVPVQPNAVVTAAKPIINGPPAEVTVHQTNRTRFKLDYALSNANEETTQVQLWATEDVGKTWRLWGIDQDGQSPLDVEIQRDGTIGFITIISTPADNGKNRPTADSVADIWIRIDRVQPQLQLGDIERTVESGFPEILIKWEATDDNLSDRPIRLQCSQSQQGPWQEISAAVPNAGFYRWRLDPNASGIWFIKVDATDQAGNVISAIVAEPVR
jgi:hypothetical protein